ncbi:MAG TPA: ribonuclease R [Bacteroidetes bacterium]|nr:ribonuclease R [Bacteroidota bacterium]
MNKNEEIGLHPEIIDAIIKLFLKTGNKKLTFKQIKKKFSHKYPAEKLHASLSILLADGRMNHKGNGYFLGKDKRNETEGGKAQTEKRNLLSVDSIEGVIEFTQNGNAWVVVPGHDNDIRIDAYKTGRAFEGDTVRVKLYPDKKRKRREGKVIEIVKRAQELYAGTIRKEEGRTVMVPDAANFPVNFFISDAQLNGAKLNDKVLVKMGKWEREYPEGEVTLVLGPAGTNDVEMNSILLEFNFNLEFPKDVLEESKNISDKIPAEEIKKRRDFRNITTFTIDPEDAKDFDDALSFQKLPNGNYEVGVHIADVAHYVVPGTALDREAYLRATSVYLVDRVVPMFPERLSNELCSLRPNEDKLCFAAVFELNSKAEIQNEWFGRTVIHSDKRFTYEEAQKVLDGESDLFREELLTLNSLAYKLREKKFKNGAINFDTTEIKFKLDAEKKPIGIIIKERKDTHLLIEDFMLLANRKVAEFVAKKKTKSGKEIPFVYRVHDVPDSEKLAAFGETALAFGYKMNLSTPKHIAKSLNKLLEDVKGKPEQHMLESLGIRTMAKAVYTTKNIGHYGLAFPFYTHFTSPIRRYPDVMSHRILAEVLTDTWSVNSKLEQQCDHSSEMERNAAEAERTSVKYKQVEFMQSRIGEDFDGVITGVTNFGMFVEIIETKCEGLVKLNAIDADFYVFDEKKHRLVGRKYGRKFQLGDTVRVKLISANMEKRQMDLEVSE